MNKQIENNDNFEKLKRKLQEFQSHRLKSTYTDLSELSEYKKISVFFFERLYSPKDYTFRNESIKHLHKILKNAVHKKALSAVGLVIELHDLSDALDDLMVEKMIELNIGHDLSMEQYKEVYRGLDNYDQRIYQIKLIKKLVKNFYTVSGKWYVGITLNTVRVASHILRTHKIMDFIYDGYIGFKRVKNIQFFIDTIDQREINWHNKIWNE